MLITVNNNPTAVTYEQKQKFYLFVMVKLIFFPIFKIEVKLFIL
jgi:hypothetical protein